MGRHLSRGLSTQYVRLLTRAVRVLPTIIILFVLLEWLFLTTIVDLKILGLGKVNWLLIEVINAVAFERSLIESFQPWTYNITGFLTDTKKLVPYILVLTWSYFILPDFREALKRLSRTTIRKITLTHFFLAAGLICWYHYTQLYGNEHSHWFGETRIGLFSVFGWIPDSQSMTEPFQTIIGTFLYRLSYTVNITIMFFVATFPLVVVSWSAWMSRHNSHGGLNRQESIFTLIPSSDQTRLNTIRFKLAPTISRSHFDAFALLIVLGLTASAKYTLLKGTLRLSLRDQLIPFAAIIAFIWFIPAAIYVWHQSRGTYNTPIKIVDLLKSLKNSQAARLILAIVTPVVIGWETGCLGAAELLHELALPASNHRTSIDALTFTSAVCTSQSTQYFDSQVVLDETRKYWEKLQSDIRIRNYETPDDASILLYWVWAARFSYLYQQSSVREGINQDSKHAIAELETIRDSLLYLDSIALLPLDKQAIETIFDAKRAMRWQRRLKAEAYRIIESGTKWADGLQNFQKSFCEPGRVILRDSATLKELPALLIAFALGQAIDTTKPINAMIPEKTRQYIIAIQNDPVGNASANLIFGNRINK